MYVKEVPAMPTSYQPISILKLVKQVEEVPPVRAADLVMLEQVDSESTVDFKKRLEGLEKAWQKQLDEISEVKKTLDSVETQFDEGELLDPKEFLAFIEELVKKISQYEQVLEIIQLKKKSYHNKEKAIKAYFNPSSYKVDVVNRKLNELQQVISSLMSKDSDDFPTLSGNEGETDSPENNVAASSSVMSEQHKTSSTEEQTSPQTLARSGTIGSKKLLGALRDWYIKNPRVDKLGSLTTQMKPKS